MQFPDRGRRRQLSSAEFGRLPLPAAAGNLTATTSPSEPTLIMARKVRVAIVGLGFGAEFIPIYQAHPDAEMAAICRRNKAELDRCGDQFGIKKRYTDFADLIKDKDIDAVHINS